MWVLFSFITAGLETVRDVLGKKTSQKTDEYVTAFATQFFGLLFFTPILIWVGIPEIKPVFWWAALGGAITVPLGNILYMKAVKLSPVSMVVPMLAFNPLFTTFFTYIFERELPGLIGWLGVVLVGIGLYCLRLNKEVLKQGWLAPIKQITKEPGALAMLGVSLVWSVGANIGKVKVTNSSPLFSVFIATLFGSLVLLMIALYQHRFDLNKIVSSIKKNLLGMSSLGLGVGLSNLAMLAALQTSFTPYVISIKRSNMVFSSIAGKFFFGEKLTKNKILGILMMFTGLVLIILS